ncbi:MAG: AmmeMemoRadiSam system radical SAM enzyme [Candidatus Aminicenantes bacterium RBG_16_63_16]|nr:MAG: AmmeMemoRadiSam system radical SAM enzyme [Candidatus Aminicenantes bacterium RBG_16_63_16]
MGNLYAFDSRVSLSRKEARFYKKHPDREIECLLCPRTCKLGDKERGYCGVRENDGGTYYTLVYGKAVSANVDPIEKKPFFHFLPRSSAFSIATAGCNVNCKFCQNWQISQVRAEQVDNLDLPPDDVVTAARRYACPVIAYTYTEPVVFYEYMYDTSVAARRAGIKNCVVTGGHVKAEPLAELVKVVDAVKVDLKGFTQDFYTNYVRGELQPVLEAIKAVQKSGVWLEVVYLVIPTLNDSSDEIRRMSRWLASEVGPDVPLHFSRFQPMYLVKNLPPTPVSTLQRAHGIACEEGLRYVYVGNVPGHPAESTYCPACRKTVVQRFGFEIRAISLDKGKCKSCGHPIPGIWA